MKGNGKSLPPPTVGTDVLEQQQLEEEVVVRDVVAEEQDAGERRREQERSRLSTTTAPVAGERVLKTSRSPELVAADRRQDQTLVDWLEGLSGQTNVKISLLRVRPVMHAGKKTNGTLASFENLITEEEIMETYGGGTYSIRVQRKNAQGSWVMWKQSQVEIAGDPRIDNLPRSGEPERPHAPAQPVSHDPLVSKAFSFMEGQVAAARHTPDASGNAAQIQAAMNSQMAILMRPFEAQMQMMQASLAAKDAQLAELNRPKEDAFQQKLLGNLIEQDSARVRALRDTYDSEIRQLKEHAKANEDRMNDRFDRERASLEKAHEREISNLLATHSQSLENIKASHATQKMILDAEVTRLKDDLAEGRGDLKELRAKKDQTITEKIHEMNALKGLLGGEDEKEKSTLEKIVETAVGSEKLMGVVGRLGDKIGAGEQPGPAAAAQQQQAMTAPARRSRVVRDKRSGQMFREDGNGHRVPLRQQAEDGTETDVIEIDPADVRMGVAFLESACRNGIDPANVATSARSMIPESIMASIRQHGVDGFLEKVAKLESSSPLTSQEGRNWVRKVGKALLGE